MTASGESPLDTEGRSESVRAYIDRRLREEIDRHVLCPADDCGSMLMEPPGGGTGAWCPICGYTRSTLMLDAAAVPGGTEAPEPERGMVSVEQLGAVVALLWPEDLMGRRALYSLIEQHTPTAPSPVPVGEREPWPTKPCPAPGDEAEDHDGCPECYGTRAVYMTDGEHPAAGVGEQPRTDATDTEREYAAFVGVEYEAMLPSESPGGPEAPSEPAGLTCPNCGASASLPLGMSCSDHRPVPAPAPSEPAGEATVWPRCDGCGERVGVVTGACLHPSCGRYMVPSPGSVGQPEGGPQ